MNAVPARYAVAGHPVEHSQSPFIHAAFAQQTGQVLSYERLPCPLDGFLATVQGFANAGASGCNVTLPFKHEAHALAARATPRAQLAGACNTLRFDAEGWYGDNTDGTGLVADIERNAKVALAGARVLLVGAGGAAAGVLGPLLAAGVAEIVVGNRGLARAEELVLRHRAMAAAQAPASRLDAAPLADCGDSFDIVINATSSSVVGAPVPVGGQVLRSGGLAVDLMYGPGAQPFLNWATRHGAQGRDGLGMLVEAGRRGLLLLARRAPRDGASARRPALAPGRLSIMGAGLLRKALRFLAVAAAMLLALQLYFLVRIACMNVADPQSTSFQRSEAWRLAGSGRAAGWQQQWVDYERISVHLKRAVIASEDAGFLEHSGVEWDAIEKAWDRNQRAETKAEQLARTAPANPAARTAKPAKVVGGSTISQQLAKNLFLAGERDLLRKGQELLLTYELEALLGKRRILEIYLNSVEWGEGVFGAEAAARHYFHVGAAELGPRQAALLAVMLPAPKRFEKRFGSPYLAARSATIAARMPAVAVP